MIEGESAGMCEVFAGQPKENYEPITRNLRLNGQSTSIRLERSFWDIIDSMANAEGVSTPLFYQLCNPKSLRFMEKPRISPLC